MGLVEPLNRQLLLLIPILLLVRFRTELPVRQLPEERQLTVAV